MNILTFDIEEWFHCDFYTKDLNQCKHEVRIFKNMDFILQSLSKSNKKATFFILGWIAEKYPEIVKNILNEGHEIGCHSMQHDLVYRMTPPEFRADTKMALNRIEQISGEKIVLYRAPAFSITNETPWAFEILLECGITHDASVFPGRRDFGGFPELGISKPVLLEINGQLLKEFPMSLMNIGLAKLAFSGGGYFRLLPYDLIRILVSNSDYVMTYFHPRDFDKDQPILEHLSKLRKFKSYYGLSNAGSKFEKLLFDFDTQTLLNASNKIDWLSANKIIL